MRIGSLCSGYGGLDLAVADRLGATVEWVSDVDRSANRILRERFGAPNHGDVSQIRWHEVAPVDVITAGYPCQPFSNAGMRRGADDPRHIWPHIRDGIEALQPAVVVLENVAAHMSLGGPQVVREITALGYYVRWGIVRAADAGAPHRRARLFIAATTNTPSQRHGAREIVGVVGRMGTPADRSGRHPGPTREVAGNGAIQDRRRGQPAADTAADAVLGEPCPSAKCAAMTKAAPSVATAYNPNPNPSPRFSPINSADLHPTIGGSLSTSANGWGEYGHLIRRWEAVTGRTAPHPVERDGSRWRSSARWIEWAMGLPDGWVTGVPIPYAAQITALGNGVVPQQAALALDLLGVTR